MAKRKRRKEEKVERKVEVTMYMYHHHKDREVVEIVEKIVHHQNLAKRIVVVKREVVEAVEVKIRKETMVGQK